MKTIRLFLFSILVLSIYSCKTGTDSPIGDPIVDSTFVDTTLIEIDTTLLAIDDTTNMAEYLDDSEEAESIIEEKYGQQWDFCDCTVKNDSINKAIENSDDLSDEQFNILYERLGEVEKHCKEVTTMPSNTPEERSKQERKVRNCLRAAGIK
jgi:hypothetical protein